MGPLTSASLRFAAASLACGGIAVFVSENLFWSAPQADWTLLGWAITWVVYAMAAAVALAAVVVTGCGGWRGLFLAGALLGFMVEGVIVDTMYDAFPAQLVWTPLAWHALLTAFAVGGLGRRAGVWPLTWLVAGWAGLGLIFGAFALYWPTERGAMPGVGPVLGYLLACGLVVPLANLVLDRIGALPRPPWPVLVVVPALAAAVWAGKTLAYPAPQRLALPVLVGLTLWAMARLGQRGRAVDLGAPAGPPGHLLALICPAVVAAVAIPLWPLTGGVMTNIPVALATGGLSLVLWLALLLQALRR